MADWEWVALGFTVAYGALVGYALLLWRRARRVDRDLEKWR